MAEQTTVFEFRKKVVKMKRAVLYTRVSTCDQNPETQALDLRRLAEQRGFEIVHEYSDRISGAKAKRPALDQMLAAAHRREFDTVLVWAADRLARSVRHFLEVLDTLNHLGIEFVSFRENLDTGGPHRQSGGDHRLGGSGAGA
jgi:DNA invertase Pin-like site-specific DNA recombinase